jgi:serine/threonine-protein kinase
MNVGEVIDGKYELVRVVGQGGMGSVWEARHAQLGRRAALKFLRPEMIDDQEAVKRFIREAQAASSIGSEYIADVTDVGFSGPGGTPYLVMEYLDGLTLTQILRRDGTLEPLRAARLIRQLCRALDAAHQRGIIHRDIKPDNVYIVLRDDGTEQIKVIDFGIAKFRAALASDDVARLTATGITLGTPYYMAPEQARAAQDLDGRVDVYSAGVVLYELLTGKPPFSGGSFSAVVIEAATKDPPSLSAARPDLPPGYEGVVLKAMARDRRDRYPSAAALAEALSPFTGLAASVGAPRISGTGPTLAAHTVPPVTAATQAHQPDVGVRTGPTVDPFQGGAAGLAPVAAVPPVTAVVPRSEVAVAAISIGAASLPAASSARAPGSRTWLVVAAGGAVVLVLLTLGALVCGGLIYRRGVQAGAAARGAPHTEEGAATVPPPPPAPAGQSISISANATTDSKSVPDVRPPPPAPDPQPAAPVDEDDARSTHGKLLALRAANMARNLHDRGDYNGCLEVLERAVPADAPAVTFWKARCHLGLGHKTRACRTAYSCREYQPCFRFLEENRCLSGLKRGR